MGIGAGLLFSWVNCLIWTNWESCSGACLMNDSVFLYYREIFACACHWNGETESEVAWSKTGCWPAAPASGAPEASNAFAGNNSCLLLRPHKYRKSEWVSERERERERERDRSKQDDKEEGIYISPLSWSGPKQQKQHPKGHSNSLENPSAPIYSSRADHFQLPQEFFALLQIFYFYFAAATATVAVAPVVAFWLFSKEDEDEEEKAESSEPYQEITRAEQSWREEEEEPVAASKTCSGGGGGGFHGGGIFSCVQTLCAVQSNIQSTTKGSGFISMFWWWYQTT